VNTCIAWSLRDHMNPQEEEYRIMVIGVYFIAGTGEANEAGTYRVYRTGSREKALRVAVRRTERIEKEGVMNLWYDPHSASLTGSPESLLIKFVGTASPRPVLDAIFTDTVMQGALLT
jgi:hypothetical protein